MPNTGLIGSARAGSTQAARPGKRLEAVSKASGRIRAWRSAGSISERTPATAFQPTTETAPAYFNKFCGYPVEREELIETFIQFFPRAKGFLFYKKQDSEVYLVIVPLKYATTISRSNAQACG